MEISVLQWNVLYQEKADNILQLIKQINADIVCLQELTQNSAANPGRDLPAEISALGYQAYYVPTSTEPELTIGNGIFSKLPLIKSKTEYVTREDLSNKDFPQYNRAYIESVLDLDGVRFTVATVHLSYSPGFIFFPDKEREARKFINLVTPNKNRYVLAGDFNATPDSNLIKELDKLLVPAGPGYSEATWTTKPFELYGFSANTLDWRLDYVFTSPDVKALSSEILKTDYSDHLPILTALSIS
jgi:endonuclease/exonuclease/phosphatase family metal-dependent hydrolase